MKNDSLFSQAEKYQHPATILFRSIELKLLKENLGQILDLAPALDLGCGDGIAAKAIFNKKIAFGLDNDSKAFDSAKKTGIYKKTILARAEKIPLKDASINFVFSNCVIEHIKNLDLVLKEVARVLKPNGFFVATVPSDKFYQYSLFSFLDLKSLAKFYGKLRNRKYQHFNIYSLKEWQKTLKKAGFGQVDGFYYINKKTLEFWDSLIIFSRLFCSSTNLGKKILFWFYKKFLKNKIYNQHLLGKKTNKDGAAICIIAQKQQ
ncbi:methyltransferase domain-containing protein [Patescibacteria group bacterium]|nr:methyltransferase domain-containing protein [Patescibacteria group bacterium]